MKNNQHIKLKDIAQKANVSISTVSHVINNTRYVKPETRETIEKIMKDYCFKKTKNSSKKNRYIGLIVADITEDYSISVIKAIENHCKSKDYSILVCDSEDDLEIEQHNVDKMLANERIRGIIISPVNSQICNKKLEKTSIPVICFDRKYENVNKIFFGINNLNSGYFAAKYLYEHNCKNIGFIGYPKEIYSVNQRELGYRLFLQQLSTQISPKTLNLNYFQENSVETISKFLKSNNIDGLICATSGVCHLSIQATQNLKLTIPQDVKIVTYDNNRWFDFLQFPISVITQPTTKIAQSSVDRIISMIENPDEIMNGTSEILFETGFIDRLKA